MDPITAVGLIASVAQLIETTAKVVQYLNDVTNAPKERATLALEATNLLALLTNLRYRLEEANATDPWYAGVRSLAVKNGPLELFKRAMEEMVSKLKPEKGARKFGKMMIWPLDKKDIKEMLGDIERMKSTVNLVLQKDQFTLSLSIKDDVGEISDSICDITSGISGLQTNQKSQRDKDILVWLSPLNFAAKQIDVLSRRQEGTGNWLLQADVFKRWVNGTDRTIWCPGPPGAGKTVLASIVVDYLERTLQQNDIAIAYIYCSYKDEVSQSPLNLIASLVHQIIGRKDAIPSEITTLYKNHIEKQTRPTLWEYSRLLQSAAEGFSKVFVIIDALDECLESGGVRDRFTSEIRKLPPNTQMLITSRPTMTIERELEGASRLEIRASDYDIRLYLEARVMEERRLARCCKDTAFREQIIEQLIESAKGMFLLARLHLDSLANKNNKKDIRSALQHLPQQLDDVYNEAMQRVYRQEEDDVLLAKQVLSWITYAFRPLSIIELQYAIAVRPGDSEFDEEALPDEDLLLSVCAGLVTADRESGLIRLVHYTTQKYFERVRIQQFPEAQFRITEACLTYLLCDIHSFVDSTDSEDEWYDVHSDLGLDELMECCPFPYAVDFWADHARGGLELDHTIQNLILQFLGDFSIFLARYPQHTKPPNIFFDSHIGPLTPTLSITAWFGLEVICSMLLRNGARVEEKDYYGWTALQYAVLQKRDAVVQLLLEKGAAVKQKRGEAEETPLHIAGRLGHDSIVRLLLDAGADLEAKECCDGATALRLAASWGHEAASKILIEYGANVMANGRNKRTILHDAVRGGYAKTALLLLKNGAMKDAQNSFGETPLHAAAKLDEGSIVDLLIKHGAALHSRTCNGETPFLMAAIWRRSDAVRLLIEKGAQTDDVDDQGQCALHWEAANGCTTMLELYLNKGIEINMPDTSKNTPLHWAARERNGDTIKFLLDHGANAGLANNNEEIPLDLALYFDVDREIFTDKMQHREDNLRMAVQLLIEKLADGFVSTYMHKAAKYGEVDTLQSLLVRGADINMLGESGNTALHIAAYRGRSDIVQLLLDNGAYADMLNGSGDTPLAVANARRNDEVVWLLESVAKTSQSTQDSEKGIITSSISLPSHAIEEGVSITPSDSTGSPILPSQNTDGASNSTIPDPPAHIYFSDRALKRPPAVKHHLSPTRLSLRNTVSRRPLVLRHQTPATRSTFPWKLSRGSPASQR
ncbi:MAG: hypothetical protein M1827_004553 [Pycnora praestabilis]|nr:MAG: hypothetical protein M1827_004553 [Pycnora praestabilis]